MGKGAHDQADAQLQKEGLGGRGHIGGGQVCQGHTHRAGHTAPEATHQQCRQHAEHITQMEGGLFRAYGDIDLAVCKAHIAQRRKQRRQGQGAYLHLLGGRQQAQQQGHRTYHRQDQAQGKGNGLCPGGTVCQRGGAGQHRQYNTQHQRHSAADQADPIFLFHKGHLLYWICPHYTIVWQ